MATTPSSEALAAEHMRLIDYVVADVSSAMPPHFPREELRAAGLTGLAEAVRTYDPSRGVPFARYANQRIVWAVLDELRSRDWATRSVRARWRAVTRRREDLTRLLGREPTLAEVADCMGVDVADLWALEDDVRRAAVINLDALVESGDSDAVVPSTQETPEAAVLRRERIGCLYAAVLALPARLRRVVIGYFFEGSPMQSLADELGVTESRISQMRAEALALLRDGINAQLDPDQVPRCEHARVAKRKASYYAAIARQGDYRSRLAAADGGLAALVLAGASA